MEEKPQQIKGINSEPRQFEPVAGMNGSGTDSKSDAGLTPTGSGFDLYHWRRDLIAQRTLYGADTPIGNRCSNLIGQLESYEHATGEDQRKNLDRLIMKSITELSRLTHNAEER